MAITRPNSWKVAFWGQLALLVAVLLAVLYGARVRLQGVKLQAQRQAEAARELAEQLRAQQVGASEHKPVILEGPIVEIVDGDTVTVRMGSHEYTIRFYGIDCPEFDQPYGAEAATLIGDVVDSDAVEVRLTDVDRYGRLVGVVLLDGKSVNLELVEAGFAWWYREYAPDDEQLAEAEAEARADNRACGPIPMRCRRGSGGRLADEQSEAGRVMAEHIVRSSA